jgi:hypothetical protein
MHTHIRAKNNPGVLHRCPGPRTLIKVTPFDYEKVKNVRDKYNPFQANKQYPAEIF